jgi:hypothetical protein
VPLDDGARRGTDPWRQIEGVPFCHWDRWLLRLALDEPEGLRGIERSLRRRTSALNAPDVEAEALLAQLADLEARLTALGRMPATALDDIERASTWLHAKALRRVWHAASFCRELAKIIAELRIAGLGRQLERARNLRSAVVAAAEPPHEGTDVGP